MKISSAIVFILASLVMLSSPPAHAGTWISSGGGSGVACFDSEADAALVRANTKPLDDATVSRIRTLFTTEIWEHKDHAFIAPESGENADTYLQRVLRAYLMPTAPSFLSKINGALARVRLDGDARTISALPRLDDLGPQQALAANCALVQIVIREARTSASGHIQASISIDSRLYDRLGTIDGRISPEGHVVNQAALQLHEALYLLGYGLGQKTSSQVRKLTAILLEEDEFSRFANLAQVQAWDHPNSPKIAAKFMIDELFDVGFGDFPAVESSAKSSSIEVLRKAYESLERSPKSSFGKQKYTDAEAIVAATILAMTRGMIEDFYALFATPVSSAQTLSTVCGFVSYENDRLHDHGDPEDTWETTNIIYGAENYCRKITGH